MIESVSHIVGTKTSLASVLLLVLCSSISALAYNEERDYYKWSPRFLYQPGTRGSNLAPSYAESIPSRVSYPNKVLFVSASILNECSQKKHRT